MSAISIMQKFPSAEIIEKYLQEDLGEVARWMTEKKVISMVAAHFSRCRWPEDPNGFKINVGLAMRDWAKLHKESGGQDVSPSLFEGMTELLIGSLQKFPQDKLVPTLEE